MQIDYEITKQQGNFNAILKIELSFQDFEQVLNIPKIYFKSSFLHTVSGINSTSSSPNDKYRFSRMNCKWEIKNKKSYLKLSTDYQKLYITIPHQYSQDKQQRLIKANLNGFQRKYEKALIKAVENKAYQEKSSIEMSLETKKSVSHFAAKHKILNNKGL